MKLTRERSSDLPSSRTNGKGDLTDPIHLHSDNRSSRVTLGSSRQTTPEEERTAESRERADEPPRDGRAVAVLGTAVVTVVTRRDLVLGEVPRPGVLHVAQEHRVVVVEREGVAAVLVPLDDVGDLPGRRPASLLDSGVTALPSAVLPRGGVGLGFRVRRAGLDNLLLRQQAGLLHGHRRLGHLHPRTVDPRRDVVDALTLGDGLGVVALPGLLAPDVRRGVRRRLLHRAVLGRLDRHDGLDHGLGLVHVGPAVGQLVPRPALRRGREHGVDARLDARRVGHDLVVAVLDHDADLVSGGDHEATVGVLAHALVTDHALLVPDLDGRGVVVRGAVVVGVELPGRPLPTADQRLGRVVRSVEVARGDEVVHLRLGAVLHVVVVHVDLVLDALALEQGVEVAEVGRIQSGDRVHEGLRPHRVGRVVVHLPDYDGVLRLHGRVARDLEDLALGLLVVQLAAGQLLAVERGLVVTGAQVEVLGLEVAVPVGGTDVVRTSGSSRRPVSTLHIEHHVAGLAGSELVTLEVERADLGVVALGTGRRALLVDLQGPLVAVRRGLLISRATVLVDLGAGCGTRALVGLVEDAVPIEVDRGRLRVVGIAPGGLLGGVGVAVTVGVGIGCGALVALQDLDADGDLVARIALDGDGEVDCGSGRVHTEVVSCVHRLAAAVPLHEQVGCARLDVDTGSFTFAGRVEVLGDGLVGHGVDRSDLGLRGDLGGRALGRVGSRRNLGFGCRRWLGLLGRLIDSLLGLSVSLVLRLLLGLGLGSLSLLVRLLLGRLGGSLLGGLVGLGLIIRRRSGDLAGRFLRRRVVGVRNARTHDGCEHETRDCKCSQRGLETRTHVPLPSPTYH